MCLASVAALLLSGVGTAHAAAPPWGACGRNTDEAKVVRQFYVNPRTYYTLRCGGPRYSDDPRYGYRHILRHHKSDFERMALGTGQNWRDVADLVMETISKDPDSAEPANGGQACLSRVLFLRNLRNNQVVREQIFAMYVDLASNNINTVYPASRQC